MIEFAVVVDGLDEDSDKARWVLAVDGEKLLIVHADLSLHWHPMADCKFARLVSPDEARPVIPVQPVRDQLVMPNRAERRRLEHGNGS